MKTGEVKMKSSKNKKFLLCTIILTFLLIFISCVHSYKTIDENLNADETSISINDKNKSYPEDGDSINSPTPSADDDSCGNTGNGGEQNNSENSRDQKNKDETGENNETEKSEDDSEKNTKEIVKINGLVYVQDIDPDIIVELRYATENNFTGKKIYPNDVCVLQEATALKLASANRELMEMGYRIKIWDAYRPVYAQRKLWEVVPDSRYVANPDKGGSKHSRGAAVDITLVDMEGNELEMPSDFDDFTGKGSRNNKNMSENARKNMELLTDVMVRNGFTAISNEWWHYNDSDSDKYGIIDVNLEE